MINKSYNLQAKDVGYRDESLKRIDTLLDGYMSEDKYAGVGYLLSRNGRDFVCKGSSGFGPDVIFPIQSITKAFIAIAIMQLVEEGLIYLGQSVATILSAFDNDTYRSITIFHLLTHTSGILPDPGLYGEAYLDFDEADPERDDWLEQMLKGLPYTKPGTQWSYSSRCFVVLSEIICKVSGEDLDDYLASLITGPLGMARTFFFVPEVYRVQVCRTDFNGLGYRPLEVAKGSDEYNPFRCGSGLYSCLEDLAILGHMFLNNGTFKGARILSRRSVRAMTQDQLNGGLADFCWGNDGSPRPFGLGLMVRSENILSKGTYWIGGYGRCGLYIDREEKFIAVLYEAMKEDEWDLLDLHGLLNVIWAGLV